MALKKLWAQITLTPPNLPSSQAPLMSLLLEPAFGSSYWNAGETDTLEVEQPKERNWED